MVGKHGVPIVVGVAVAVRAHACPLQCMVVPEWPNRIRLGHCGISSASPSLRGKGEGRGRGKGRGRVKGKGRGRGKGKGRGRQISLLLIAPR